MDREELARGAIVITVIKREVRDGYTVRVVEGPFKATDSADDADEIFTRVVQLTALLGDLLLLRSQHEEAP